MSTPYNRKEQIECQACGEQVDVFLGDVIRCPMCGEEIDARDDFDRPPTPPRRPFYPPFSTGEKVSFFMIGALIYAASIAFTLCAGAM